MTLQITPLPLSGEIAEGADLATLVVDAAPALEPGDVIVIAHKAVAKAEGRVVNLAEVVPSPRAVELAGEDGDPRQLELVLRESRRIVRRRGSLVIAETHHGFICASAGIDRSNAPGPRYGGAAAARSRSVGPHSAGVAAGAHRPATWR